MFLMPTEGDDFVVKGIAKMQMLESTWIEEYSNKIDSATELYEHYLSDKKKIDISKLRYEV